MSEVLRVAMITRFLPPEHSGAGRQAALQARAVAATGSADVALIGGVVGIARPRRRRDGHMAVVRYPVTRRGSRLERVVFSLWVLADVLLHRYDVVHLHGSPFVLPFLAAAKRLRRFRIVFKPTMAGKDDALAVMRRSPTRVRAVDGWFCTTGAIAASCSIAGVPDAQVFRVSNAVDAVSSPPVRPTDGRATWLSVGAIQPRKRPHLLVEAWARLARPRPRLVLVGPVLDAAYARTLEETIDDLDLGEDIELVGLRDDVPSLLAGAAGVVLASNQEGLPNAALEGLAAGLPVVLTDFPGAADVAHLAPDRVQIVDGQPSAVASAVECAEGPGDPPDALAALEPSRVAAEIVGAYALLTHSRVAPQVAHG